MKTARSETTTAWFGALCFFLSTVEYMIPKPLPFLRLGLANLPLMLSIEALPFPFWCVLILIKILGQGLIGGPLFSYVFLFSAAGTITSAFVMYTLKKGLRGRISWIGISVAGAFASNAAQLSLARFYIFGESAWYIAPPFIAVGIASGTLLGIFANGFSRKSVWYAKVLDGTIQYPEMPVASASTNVFQAGLAVNPVFRFGLGAVLILTLCFASHLAVQLLVTALALILLLADRSRIRLLPAILMATSIILFNLCTPFGRVLARPFNLPLTDGALFLGIKKVLTMEGMIFISRWILKPGFRLPGKTGGLVSQAFRILGYLTDSRRKLDPKNLTASIDSIMFGHDQAHPRLP